MNAKSKTVETTAPATEQTVESTKPEPKLTMKSGLKYRGARQAWYERLIALEGKDRAAMLADLEAKRPSVYGAKSKHAGKPEPVAGWVRFFEREGVATWK